MKDNCLTQQISEQTRHDTPLDRFLMNTEGLVANVKVAGRRLEVSGRTATLGFWRAEFGQLRDGLTLDTPQAQCLVLDPSL